MPTVRCSFTVALMLMAGCDSPPPESDTSQIFVDSAAAVTVSESFETADHWQTIEGEWVMKTREGQPVLKQIATDRDFPVVLLEERTFSDVDVRVTFRTISGQLDASGGIVFRSDNGSNYYVVRANSLEDNFRLYTVIDGHRSQIAGTGIEAPALGKPHSLRVVAVGDHIQAYLNETLLIDHHDQTFASGRVGLWTKADAVTEFSHFVATGKVANPPERNTDNSSPSETN